MRTGTRIFFMLLLQVLLLMLLLLHLSLLLLPLLSLLLLPLLLLLWLQWEMLVCLQVLVVKAPKVAKGALCMVKIHTKGARGALQRPQNTGDTDFIDSGVLLLKVGYFGWAPQTLRGIRIVLQKRSPSKAGLLRSTIRVDRLSNVAAVQC